ncbi:M15 family metallopeptidase [Pararhizobium sp.]|uniref:M15 family metallopeptidase n=1 Tax=Pararhizobium sp. TaxID=1977563 RepID=UPI003D141D23
MSRSIDRELASLAFAALLAVAFPAFSADLTLTQKLDLLVSAYPDGLSKHEDGSVRFRDGGFLPVDDGKAKNHVEKLAAGDIEDSLSQIYPAGPCETKPNVNFDPGRIRSDALMMRLYGKSANEVKASLVPVEWFGKTLRVTNRHGAAAALEKVRDELKAMPEMKAFLAPSAGTFNWRKVSGAPNMSVHSFGAAIDINTKYADYWIWSGGKPGRVAEYRNKYPMKIVDAFERHGFIWGGRWYHYDTMHFEYRPELIAIGKAAGVSACR